MNLTTILYCIDVRGSNCYRVLFVFLITGVAVKNTLVTRRVLSETKAIMSPPHMSLDGNNTYIMINLELWP